MNAYELIKPFELEKVDFFLEQILPERNLKFGDVVVGMMSGKGDANFLLIWEAFQGSLLYGLSESRYLFVTMILYGVIASVLQAATGIFKGKQAMQLAKYFILLLVSLILMHGFDAAQEICTSTVMNVSDFMKVILPVLSMSLGVSHGTLSAYGYYQFMFLVIYVLGQILLRLFLPLTRCYLLLVFMNAISDEKRFEGIVNLLEKGVGNGLKLLASLLLGGGFVRSVLLAKVDHVGRTMVGKAVGAVPVVGDVSDSATQVLLSCADLVKCYMGGGALVALVIVCSMPLLRLFVLLASLHLSSAFVGLVGEKRTMHMLQQAGKGFFMLFQIAFFTVLVFALTITMMLRLSTG